MSSTEVILVNEHDEAVGTMEKLEAHRKAVLHRAFSIFIFNDKGEMLLQQRAEDKYHSPGLWTNACCSHPAPGEDIHAAAVRRLEEELGFSVNIRPAFTFTYKAIFTNGLTEHEYDHVFVGNYNGPIKPDVNEVKDFKFINMDDLSQMLNEMPTQFTSWFLIAFPKIRTWLEKNKISL
jgi:isopentenyl-diphosphate delta-isomerase